jgi:Tol biopolymer transport system component
MHARAWIALAASALVLGVGAESVPAAFPGTNGRIAVAVQEWRGADPCSPVPHGCEPELVSSRIETFLPNGRGRRVLRAFEPSEGVSIDNGPVWSPDGRLLVFQQGARLGTIRRDGTGLRILPQLTINDREPTWSADGRRIAFVGERLCPYCTFLYSVRPDGSDLRRLMRPAARWPAWSATDRLVFVNYDDQPRMQIGLDDGLYTVRPDGSRLRRVFRRYWGPGVEPDWSPDGSRIAFAARRHIFTIGASGRGLERVTEPRRPRVAGADPAWSPDGRQIAFLRGGDLYVARSDGGRLRRIFDAPQQDLDDPSRHWLELSGPGWQPLR